MSKTLLAFAIIVMGFSAYSPAEEKAKTSFSAPASPSTTAIFNFLETIHDQSKSGIYVHLTYRSPLPGEDYTISLCKLEGDISRITMALINLQKLTDEGSALFKHFTEEITRLNCNASLSD